MLPKRSHMAAGLVSSALFGSTALAQPAAIDSTKLTGLWFTTDYPAITHAIGDEVVVDIVMENRNIPPQNLKLDVKGLPAQWSWQFKGDGRSIGAATVRPDQTVELQLSLTPPKEVKAGEYSFTVSGVNGGEAFELPITLNLTAKAEAKVELEPKLPALRGTPKSNFDFDLTIRNEAKDDQVFNLLASAPPGFQTIYKEQYGSNELTSIPVKAGGTSTVKLSVVPPGGVSARQYPVQAAVMSPAAKASADLLIDVTGQPNIMLEATDGRLSGDATAGRERSFNFVVSNTGTAEAKDIKLSSSSPSGWKVTFTPETIAEVKPGEKADITVIMVPSDKAITGDYMVTIKADGSGASDSSEFRVTVKTSTVWGIAGLGIIGASLLAFGASVARFGRR